MNETIPTSLETLRETDMKNAEEALKDVTDLLNYQTKFGRHLDEIKTHINDNTISDLEKNVLNLFYEKILSIVSHLKDIIAVKVDLHYCETSISFNKENNVSPYVQVSKIINDFLNVIKDTIHKLPTIQYEKL